VRYRQLGRSGLRVSVVGLGCNNLRTRSTDEESALVVHAALNAGVTLFDTADYYGDGGSEEILGTALGKRRDEAVVATKFGLQMPGEPRPRPAVPAATSAKRSEPHFDV
jgi:aryl-alcohol dehydrogenase-like predicted oxidoreductase